MNLRLKIIHLAFLMTSLAACSPIAQPVYQVDETHKSVNIQDPQLLEAWESLHKSDRTLLFGINGSIKAQELAAFVVEHAIPVQFDNEGICRGSSCSIRYCAGKVCEFEDGHPGIDPIYISMHLKGDPDRLICALVHEIFHRIEPFGAVRDTLYEEYWAYAIEAQLFGIGEDAFSFIDPSNPEALSQWFLVNQPGDYNGLESYPDQN